MSTLKALVFTTAVVSLASACSVLTNKNGEATSKKDDCVSDYSKISVKRFSGIESKNNEGLSVQAGTKTITEYVRLQDKYILQLKYLETLCKLHRAEKISDEEYYLALIENESQIIKIKEIIRSLETTAKEKKYSGFPSDLYTNNLFLSLDEALTKLVLDLENAKKKVNTANLRDEVLAIKNLANSEAKSEKETIKVYALAADFESAIEQLYKRLEETDNKLGRSPQDTKSKIEILSYWLDSNFTSTSDNAIKAEKERIALKAFACDIARSFNDPRLWELCQ